MHTWHTKRNAQNMYAAGLVFVISDRVLCASTIWTDTFAPNWHHRVVPLLLWLFYKQLSRRYRQHTPRQIDQISLVMNRLDRFGLWSLLYIFTIRYEKWSNFQLRCDGTVIGHWGRSHRCWLLTASIKAQQDTNKWIAIIWAVRCCHSSVFHTPNGKPTNSNRQLCSRFVDLLTCTCESEASQMKGERWAGWAGWENEAERMQIRVQLAYATMPLKNTLCIRLLLLGWCVWHGSDAVCRNHPIQTLRASTVHALNWKQPKSAGIDIL